MNRAIRSAELDTRPGWGHAEDVVPIASGFANRDASDPTVRTWAARAVAEAQVPRGDTEGAARAIMAAALRDVRYTDDPIQRQPSGAWDTHDLVQAPIVTLDTGAGDCVALSTLIGAGLQSVGVRTRYVVSGNKERPRHITVEAEGPGGWFTVDPVPTPPRVGYGQALPGTQRAWTETGEQIPVDAVRVQAPPAQYEGEGGPMPLETVPGAYACPGPLWRGGSGQLGDGLGVPPEVLELREEVIKTELGAAVLDKIEQAMPALDHLNAVAQAVDRGDPTGMEQADAIMSGVSSALMLAGPYGAIVAAVARAFWALGKWLVKTYPAEQISCSKDLPATLPQKFGYEGAYADGRFYRDAGFLFVASYLQRIDSAHSWEAFYTGEAYGQPRFDIGSDNPFGGSGWDDFAFMCQPRRGYSTPKPPGVAYRSWGEWEAAHPDLPIVEASKAALAKIARDVRARVFDGGLNYFAFQMGDHCKCYGYLIPVSSLPDSTLLELVRRCMGFVDPEGDESIDPELLASALAEEEIPPGADLPETAFVTYSDGLAAALYHYISQSPFKDYHFSALLSEYGKRRDAGTLAGLGPREVAPAAPTFMAAPPREEMRAALLPYAERADALEPRTDEPGAELDEPIQVLPPPPPEAPAELPEAIPTGQTTEEAMVLAAIRYRDSVRQAQRADAAARAYYGMSGGCASCHLGAIGADTVRIADPATEAELAAALSSAEDLRDAQSVTSRAKQTNFGLNHWGEASMPTRRVADRLMAWKKASGISPVDSTVTAAILARLAREGEFSTNALPELDELRAKGAVDVEPGAAVDMPVEVLPPGTLPAEDPGAGPPTPTGLVAAVPERTPMVRGGIPAGGGVPAAEGAPGAAAADGAVPDGGTPGTSRAFPEGAEPGAVMIAPPGSADVVVKTKADPVILILLIVGLWIAAKRRRGA